MPLVQLAESIESLKLLCSEKGIVLFQIDNEFVSVALWDDSFFAFQNECPHSGAKLNRGRVNHIGEIVCPLHGYRFRLTDGVESHSKCQDLKTYEVIYDQDAVFLNWK